MIEILPTLSRAQMIRCWAAFEGCLADKVPIVGESVKVPGLFHVCGFSAHGFQLAPHHGTPHVPAGDRAGNRKFPWMYSGPTGLRPKTHKKSKPNQRLSAPICGQAQFIGENRYERRKKSSLLINQKCCTTPKVPKRTRHPVRPWPITGPISNMLPATSSPASGPARQDPGRICTPNLSSASSWKAA